MVSLYRLQEWNKSYREGNPLVSDEIYDAEKRKYEEANGLINLLDDVNSSPSIILEYPAGSLDKIDKFDELMKFIGDDRYIVLTPKLDGIAIIRQNGISSTRGDDGYFGNDVSHHFAHISNPNCDENCRGEVVIPNDLFSKHFNEYSHPRNAVAGLFNPKTNKPKSDLLKHVVFIKFQENIKGEQINSCELSKKIDVKSPKFSENVFVELFKEWSSVYPCDGIVVSRDEPSVKFDGDINPINKIAYKPKIFSKGAKSVVVGVTRQPSAVGKVSPVINIKPVEVDGGLISNIYVDNEAFVKCLGIGVGSEIELIRSGGIIPRLVSVNDIQLTFERDILKRLHETSSDPFSIIKENFGTKNTINLYKKPDFEYTWKGLDIYISSEGNVEVLCRKIEYFLKNLGCKNFGEKTIRTIINEFAVSSLEEFLCFDIKKLIEFDGYGSKAVQILEESLQSINNVGESKLMSSVRLFDKLGEEKLKIYLKEGVSGKGLGEHAASEISKNIESYNKFREFFINTGRKIYDDFSDITNGNVYCHTKCRIPKDVIKKLESDGHKVVDSYSKKVTHIVVPSMDVTSSKIKKGISDGAEVILLSSLMSIDNKSVVEQSLF